MTSAALLANLPGWINQSKVFCGGSNYAAPTLAWLQGTFYDFFRARLWSDSLQAWVVKWECRDFARAYACYAQECNALTPATPGGADILTVGEVWFIPDADRYGVNAGQLAGTPSGGGHAINLALVETGWVFIDPQVNLLWQMTEAELKSIYFLRF